MIDNILPNTRSKKPNTETSYINEPKFGHIYAVFSLVLEGDIMIRVAGFVPNENGKVFLRAN